MPALAALLLALVACTAPSAVTAPDAPTDLSATVGNASLAIDFTIPSDGGSPILLLEYSVDDGATWSNATSNSSPLRLGSLTNEQPVTVRLRATNATGVSPVSEALTATPTLWPFATRAGGTSADRAVGVSTLAGGGAIVTGNFVGSASFGATTLTSAGQGDVFVARVDPDGGWAWATRAGGTGGDGGTDVGALADGGAIVTGTFNDSATFGATTLTSAGFRDVFVARVDPDGSWAWATRAGGTSFVDARSISTLADGSAIIAGEFQGTATFGATTFASAGSRDAFVAKIDADGNWAWANRGGGIENQYVNGVTALADGGALIAGWFAGTADFGGNFITSLDGADVFVARVDADGSWVWVTRAGGSLDAVALDVVAVSDGGAVVTGLYQGTVQFGIAVTLASAGDRDVFVAKLDPDGNWAWAISAGGTGDDRGTSVAALADGGALVTGRFEDTATFGATSLTSAGSRDVFVARVDPDGSWAWATRAGGTDVVDALSVDTFADGSAIVAGEFWETATFGATTFASAGNLDAFVAKVSENGAW
jgi:hypothetical protein